MPTLEEIARLSDVSRFTVSRVINEDPKFNSNTRERVNEVIRRLNFQPNQAVRNTLFFRLGRKRAATSTGPGNIPALRDLIRETTGRDLPVAVTEINSDWSQVCCGEATPDSFYNAIWWGDSLGRMIRQGVDIVAHFVIQSAPGGAGAGMGLLANYEVRPTYYVYRMYALFGQERVQATSDDPLVSVYAARRPDGALTVMLINLGAEAVQRNLTLAGFSPTDAVETWSFDKEHFAEQVPWPPFTNGAAAELPAESMSLIIFNP